jgi:hypothetical protein
MSGERPKVMHAVNIIGYAMKLLQQKDEATRQRYAAGEITELPINQVRGNVVIIILIFGE